MLFQRKFTQILTQILTQSYAKEIFIKLLDFWIFLGVYFQI